MNEFWYLGAGIVLVIVLYEYAPKWAGWLLVVLALGFLARNAGKVGLA